MDIMKSAIKKIASLIPLSWLERLISWKVGYPAYSYAPDGEDLHLVNMFKRGYAGFYVDVGAHHPTRFSNTRLLYQRGWHGMNVDALPGSMKVFRKERPEDINIEAALSKDPKTLTFHMFKEPAYNTLSQALADEYVHQGQVKIDTLQVRTETLSGLLEKNLSSGQKIDLLTIDVEGYDLEVLQSNDWSKWQPDVIAIESIGFDVENPTAFPIYNYLKNKDYNLEIAMPKTIFFRKK